jgi:outer membrane receptor protein involved in Fe transport
MLPNIMAEIGTGDKRFTFLAGWTGYIRRTSYQYLASINPYIDTPDELNNTRVTERFAGFKGSIGDHFTYSTKLGYNQLKNQPLFTNVNGAYYDETFHVVYEPEMKVVHFGGELGYTEQEKFSILAAINYNQYMDLEVYDKAFGLVPFEMKGSARVQVMKDLWLKSDIYLWEGAQYMTPGGGSAQLKGSFDLNAGLEFKVSKNLKVWADFNNIFNKDYEQWKLYNSYGFNFLAGIIFAFDQKTR